MYNIVFEYLHEAGNNNAIFTPTFGNELGGMWYQALMIFSWGIYNVWTPRSSFPFYKYFFSLQYVIATIAIYATILVGASIWLAKPFSKIIFRSHYQLSPLKQVLFIPRITFFIILTTILAVSIFLAKGAQEPFGNIFLFLYSHIPFFSVFRTADIRFGFPIILSISFLLVLIGSYMRPVIFVFLFTAIILYQSPVFFNGIVVDGQNIHNKFYDHILYVPDIYQETIRFFEKQPQTSGFILPFPSDNYGDYMIDTNKHFVGQDILSKFIEAPFLYLSPSDGIYTKAYALLRSGLLKKNYGIISQFPIFYIVIRHDIACSDCVIPSDTDLHEVGSPVLQNKVFSVYKVNHPTPLISGRNISFEMLNPIKYKVHISNLKTLQSLQFLLSFNKAWQIYLEPAAKQYCSNGRMYFYSGVKECVTARKYFEGNELSYLLQRPLFDSTHKLLYGYANDWTIDSSSIKKNYSTRYYTKNADGSINVDLVIYYTPQSWFYFTLLMSICSTIIVLLFIFFPKQRKKLSDIIAKNGI